MFNDMSNLTSDDSTIESIMRAILSVKNEPRVLGHHSIICGLVFLAPTEVVWHNGEPVRVIG